MTTSHKITNLLNKNPLTINELSLELGISRNSVHLQVSKLEAAGIVEKFQRNEASGAGKPAYCYRTVAGNEDSFSSAYKPVLAGLIQTIRDDLSEKERVHLLERAGYALAQSAGLNAGDSFDEDINKALDTANTLGAMAELNQTDDGAYVSCHSCPVATMVHTDPLMCRMMAAFFAQATGKQVEVKCRREGALVCGFAFESGQFD